MELLVQAGVGLIGLSMVTVIVSVLITKSQERTYRRLKRRHQRDRADRHITKMEVSLKNLEDRIVHLETKVL